jgi:transaldolase
VKKYGTTHGNVTLGSRPAGKTLAAAADHADITGDTVTDSYPQAGQVLADLERLDVSYTEVTAQLETEGVAKFKESWTQLLTTVEGELTRFPNPTDEEPTRTD